MEQLAVLHVVAVLELLVRQQIAVRVQDALGEPGRARRVEELRRVVGGGVGKLVFRRRVVHERLEVVAHHEHPLGEAVRNPVAVRRVGHDEPGARVAQPVLDALVAVQHGHREQDRAALVGAQEDRGRLWQRRQQRGDAVAPLDADRLEHVREPVGELLELPERHAALIALPVLPDHREAAGLVLVAHVAGDVVALRNVPAVRRAHFLVATDLVLAEAHRLEGSHVFGYGRDSDQTRAQTPTR